MFYSILFFEVLDRLSFCTVLPFCVLSEQATHMNDKAT